MAFCFIFSGKWLLFPFTLFAVCGAASNRIKITLKFFIYTVLGSLFMLAGLSGFIFIHSGAARVLPSIRLLTVNLPPMNSYGYFSRIFCCLCHKNSCFPVSQLAAGYLHGCSFSRQYVAGRDHAKDGALRYPSVLLHSCFLQRNWIRYAPVVMVLAITGLIYGSIIAILQKEVKRLIAYSSFAHVGLMAAALFALTADAMQGTIYQMISHGFNVMALFFVADIIQRRTNTLQIMNWVE